MASATRLSEQSHGALRYSLPMGVSMKYTDAKHKFMMNVLYHYREARRKKKREAAKKKGGTNYGVKHDDTKALQIEAAEATVGKCIEYRRSAIKGLPDSVKSKIVIRNLKKAGCLEDDKLLEDAKMKPR